MTATDDLDTTLSFRINAADAQRIRDAADTAGMNQSDWIRQTCVYTARASGNEKAALAAIAQHLGSQLDTVARKLHELANDTDTYLKVAGQMYGPVVDAALQPSKEGSA